MSFVEVLVSIVLIGTVVIGLLAAARVTIIGTAIERDHARAHQWLQGAEEYVVNAVSWSDCSATKTGAYFRSQYQTALQAQSQLLPPDWQAPQVEIPTAVLFAQPDGSFGATCYAQLDRQLIRIQVRNLDSQIIESVDVVKAP
jgi:Tfp pilus assembly protein PilV